MVPRDNKHLKMFRHEFQFLGNHLVLFVDVLLNKLIFLIWENTNTINNIAANYHIFQAANYFLVFLAQHAALPAEPVKKSVERAVHELVTANVQIRQKNSVHSLL